MLFNICDNYFFSRFTIVWFFQYSAIMINFVIVIFIFMMVITSVNILRCITGFIDKLQG